MMIYVISVKWLKGTQKGYIFSFEIISPPNPPVEKIISPPILVPFFKVYTHQCAIFEQFFCGGGTWGTHLPERKFLKKTLNEQFGARKGYKTSRTP